MMLDRKVENGPSAGFWDGPLGYAHSFVAVAAAFVIGCLLHLKQPTLPVTSLTVAAALCAVFTVLIVLAVLRWRHTRIVVWLTGIPFAITSVSAVMFLAALGAAVPQSVVAERLHAHSFYSTWPFVMVLLTMLASLVGVCARRTWPLDVRNIRFLLNHAGLAVTLLGAVISAAGLQRTRIVLNQGQPEAFAENENGVRTQLPFSVTLNKFHLTSFPPTLGVAVADEKAQDGVRVIPGSLFVKPGMTERIGAYRVTVEKHLPRAAKVGGKWLSVGFPTAANAAQVSVTDASGDPVASGWVACKSPDSGPVMLPLSDDTLLFMPPPRPKEYRSSVTIQQASGARKAEVSVNQPVSVGGWRLYQISYDEQMGAASTVSVLEAVRDVGLPVVYAGLFMMLAGAAMLLWDGGQAGGAK